MTFSLKAQGLIISIFFLTSCFDGKFEPTNKSSTGSTLAEEETQPPNPPTPNQKEPKKEDSKEKNPEAKAPDGKEPEKKNPDVEPPKEEEPPPGAKNPPNNPNPIASCSNYDGLKENILKPSQLSLSDLSKSISPPAPIHSSAFAMEKGGGPPGHIFEGRLELLDESKGRLKTHQAASWIGGQRSQTRLPEFNFHFVQCKNHLIPTNRGRITTSNTYWDYFLSPGKVWTNKADGNYTRASFPFALMMKVENCTQNGVMTFLYNDDGVSHVRYQITQETCHFHRFDLWGQSKAVYHKETIQGANKVKKDYLAELQRQIPTKPFTELKVDYPELDMKAFDQGLTLQEMSARGAYYKGVYYQDKCRTRFGEYAYCNKMLLPSFSLAKTMFVGTVMLAIAQEYGTEIYSKAILELLPKDPSIQRAGKTWKGVTLGHLVDMASGHYNVPGQGDDAVGGFYLKKTLWDKLIAAFKFPKRMEPGKKTVYLTPTFQIAVAAIEGYLKSKNSPIVDAFNYAVEKIYKPAGFSPESFSSLRSWENGGQNNGTAFGGYGMVLTGQTIIKYGQLVLLNGGKVGDLQILHPEKLKTMMFKNKLDRGAPMNYKDWSYKNGMWGSPLKAIYGCDKFVSTMFGLSGITVHMHPNGFIYFNANDELEKPYKNIIFQANVLSPICK